MHSSLVAEHPLHESKFYDYFGEGESEGSIPSECTISLIKGHNGDTKMPKK